MSYCTLEDVANNEVVVQLPSGDIQKMHIEEYVKGVVPREMPASWPMAALEAQAICARTYALAQKGRHKDQGFDVCSTAHCQVYSDEQHERTNLAVERTWSIVGMYEGKLRPMWFSSSCGGQTKDTFWADSYLRVRDDCPCVSEYECEINGHQNGLCQWGARALAEDMKTWKEILNFYYDLTYVDNYGVSECDDDLVLDARLLILENVMSEVEALGLNTAEKLSRVALEHAEAIVASEREVVKLKTRDDEALSRIAALAANYVLERDEMRARLNEIKADLEVLAPLIRLLGGRRAE